MICDIGRLSADFMRQELAEAIAVRLEASFYRKRLSR
jgi:hypothetical protein